MRPLSTTTDVKLAVLRDMSNPNSSPDQYQFATPELRQLYIEGIAIGKDFHQTMQDFAQPLKDAKRQSTHE